MPHKITIRGAYAETVSDQMERFRDGLVRARTRSRISQERLAAELGVSGRHIGQIEAGRVQPRLSLALALDHYFRDRTGSGLMEPTD